MRRNSFRLLWLAALWTGLVGTAYAAEPKLVTMLDKGEPFEALTFHDGVLWVGQSRQDFNSSYRLQVYDRNDQQLTELTLPHSLAYVHPYGAHSVIVIGTGYEPNLTQYTIVEKTASGFTKRTKQIPAEAWAFRWLGTLGGKEFFADFSGNTNDPERDRDPNLASQTLFTMSSMGSPRYLPVRIRAPFDGIKAGRNFFVLHKYAIGQPASNIAKVDPATNFAYELFETPRNELLGVAALADGTTLVASEANEDRALVIDASGTTAKVIAEVKVKDRPRSVANFGHCVLVGRESGKKIDVVDVRYPSQPKPLLTVDFSAAGESLRGIRSIAVDAETGRLYGRSSYACNPMAEACSVAWNSVYAAKIDDAEVLERCKKS